MKRPRLIGASALLITAAALPLGHRSAAERAAATAAEVELIELARLAGLEGGDDRRSPVPVRLDFEGDPWGEAVVAQAIGDSGVFELRPGPHALVAQFIDGGSALAVQIALERRGWSIRAPQPTRRRVLPAGAAIAAAAGAAAWLRRRSALLGWWIAAVGVQLIAAAWPWPLGFPRPSVDDDILGGPVMTVLRSLANDMRQFEVAIAAGVLALCVVLIAFDHRRSRSQGFMPAIRGLLGVVGAIVFVEGAARIGLAAWVPTVAGLIGSVAAAVAVALFMRARTGIGS